jgi:hypothetical protein
VRKQSLVVFVESKAGRIEDKRRGEKEVEGNRREKYLVIPIKEDQVMWLPSGEK